MKKQLRLWLCLIILLLGFISTSFSGDQEDILNQLSNYFGIQKGKITDLKTFACRFGINEVLYALNRTTIPAGQRVPRNILDFFGFGESELVPVPRDLDEIPSEAIPAKLMLCQAEFQRFNQLTQPTQTNILHELHLHSTDCFFKPNRQTQLIQFSQLLEQHYLLPRIKTQTPISSILLAPLPQTVQQQLELLVQLREQLRILLLVNNLDTNDIHPFAQAMINLDYLFGTATGRRMLEDPEIIAILNRYARLLDQHPLFHPYNDLREYLNRYTNLQNGINCENQALGAQLKKHKQDNSTQPPPPPDQ